MSMSREYEAADDFKLMAAYFVALFIKRRVEVGDLVAGGTFESNDIARMLNALELGEHSVKWVHADLLGHGLNAIAPHWRRFGWSCPCSQC